MNRIYRKVWDADRGVIVASELAKAKGKGKGGRLLQAVALAGALSAGSAMAGDVCTQTGGGAAPTAPGASA
ncbi:MAG: ESPR-type extended signal peptide-containing protein, partial [Pseudoxanthomonas sp.]